MSLLALTFTSLMGLMPARTDLPANRCDSVLTDTLREVTVSAGRVLRVDSFDLKGDHSTLKQPLPPPSFGDVIEKLLPGFNDKATHPFAIKQRRRERRHKRAMRALDNFDKVKSFDDLLRESYERQLLEDSISGYRH